MYNGYPIGILMKKYLGYKRLNEILLNLTPEQKIIVRDRIKFLLSNLVDNDVYMRDVKFDNIIINEETLDVKIIDLDDQETVVGNRAHVKENCLKSIEKFLNLYNSYIEGNIISQKR